MASIIVATGNQKGDYYPLGRRTNVVVRDEAHRFAQHYHHILRNKKMLNKKSYSSYSSVDALK
jgi:hypothetical protein